MDRGRGRIRHNRGRNSPMGWSPCSSDHSKRPHNPVVEDGLSSSKSCLVKDGRKSSQQTSGGRFWQSPGSQPPHCTKQLSSSCERDVSFNVTTCQLEQSVPDTLSSYSEELNHSVSSKSVAKVIPSFSALSGSVISSIGASSIGEQLFDVSHKLEITDLRSQTELPLRWDDPGEHLESRNATVGHKTVQTENTALVDPFDICPPKESQSVVLKPSLLASNRERRNETKRNMDSKSRTVLRPGMILLKGYISLNDQVKIVGRCRQLGLGSGGFYQPGYREGTKLHLKMMCLGKNWDPQTSEYGDHRPLDGAKPPNIPVEFLQLTEKAIRDSHVLIGQDSKTGNPEKILPWMSPNICLVNFYSQSGRLGLHQDKDESEESLRRGLPVVSFSIGDSADFLYVDERDVDKAQKVVLESGDVLIFGGKSRNIFHGVSVIHPNTAPKLLLEETNLRSGRLNLTLRQY